MVMLGQIARVELEINNLKQNADDLRAQLDQKREQNFRLQQMKVTQNEFDLSSASNYNEKLQSRHHSLMDRAEHGKDKKQPLSSSSCRHSTQHLLPDTSSNPKSAGNSASTEAGINPLVGINSRKSGAKGEGTNPPFSVLSKLTNRLHFLKDKKNQIPNELQNMEKDRNTGQSNSLERVSGSESRKSSQRIEKPQGSEERGKVVESLHYPDKERSEGSQGLEQGNSENLQTEDKSSSAFSQRTYSR